jgi:hypothetical protein
MSGEPSWVRTSDLLIKSQLLYRLSYGPLPRAALRERAGLGQACVKLCQRKTRYRIAPAGGNCGSGGENKRPQTELSMRDC